MCQRSIFARSCARIAEEVQLQAEEEWIVDALRKVKQQRNCLQIERLHLESLKVQFNEPTESTANKRAESGHVSAVTMMNPGLGAMRQNWDTFDEDMLCNKQELDLMVTKPEFETPEQQESQCEYDLDEDDDKDEDDDDDNVMIDMNMFMNGTNEFEQNEESELNE